MACELRWALHDLLLRRASTRLLRVRAPGAALPAQLRAWPWACCRKAGQRDRPSQGHWPRALCGAGRPGDEARGRLVLGIETSCDDTAAAIVSEKGRVLGECVMSSTDLHAKWGGIVPTLAQEAHSSAIDEVVSATLARAGIIPSELDAVAVTIGPGLSLCLKVGVLKARQVAHEAGVPLIPVHHMEAHAMVARLCSLNADVGGDAFGKRVSFPFLALLVSGGHNLLVLVRGMGNYTILGTTLDDAAGEAFDKVARLLGLDLTGGGGPALERLAREGDPHRFPFPVPLKTSRDKARTCDFSFAGLKTAVRTRAEREGIVGAEGIDDGHAKADMAASFQRVAVAHIVERTRRAAEWAREECPEIASIVAAGGVASNGVLREGLTRVAEEAGMALACPPPSLCTDNGVMVAWTGVERLVKGEGAGEVPVSAAPREGEWVDLRPRWPLGERDARSRVAAKSMKRKNVKMSLTEETMLRAADQARVARRD